MRSFIALLALPFFVAAQNTTFGSDPKFQACSKTCVEQLPGGPAAEAKCQDDYACYCTIDNGNLVTQIAGCMQTSCPDVLSQYLSALTSLCASQSGAQSSGVVSSGVVSSMALSSSVPGSSVTGSMPVPTTIINGTWTSAIYSSGVPTHTTKHKNTTKTTGTITGTGTESGSPTESGSTTESGGSSGNSGNGTNTKSSKPTSSTAAAAVLEAAVQWPLAIIIGLVGAAAL